MRLDELNQREGLVGFVVAEDIVVVGLARFQTVDCDGMHVPVDNAVCNRIVTLAVLVWNVFCFVGVVHYFSVRDAEKSEVDERNILRFGLRKHGCVYAVAEIFVRSGVEIVGRIACISLEGFFLRSSDFADDVSVLVKESESAVQVLFGVELYGVRRRRVGRIEVCGHARGNSAVVLRCSVERRADR